jgi:hypothetical protein
MFCHREGEALYPPHSLHTSGWRRWLQHGLIGDLRPFERPKKKAGAKAGGGAAEAAAGRQTGSASSSSSLSAQKRPRKRPREALDPAAAAAHAAKRAGSASSLEHAAAAHAAAAAAGPRIAHIMVMFQPEEPAPAAADADADVDTDAESPIPAENSPWGDGKVSMRTKLPVQRPRDEAMAEISRIRCNILGGDAGAPDIGTRLTNNQQHIFKTLATSLSDCGSHRSGGLLSSGSAKTPSRFQQAAAALVVGNLSGVVESSSGLHILLRV